MGAGAPLGAVTAAPVTAPHDLPAFPNSSMDGYALRASDLATTPVVLRVVDEILAGRVSEVTVGRGEAARIMTGAAVPAGTDAVVQIEHTRSEEPGTVTVLEPVLAGTNVRLPGGDVAAGQTVFDAGTALEPLHLGVLASLGITAVTVHRVPRVGVLSTGDEVTTGEGPAGAGMIRDANRPTLLGLLARSGFVGVDLGVVRDDEEAISWTISGAASRCDAILTTGGVSMGDVDFVRVVLEKLTAGHMRWMKVAIKPAKPFAFGVLAESGVPVFGLAGNPVSAVVGFELFARPALRKMAGHTVLDRPVVVAVAETPLRRECDGKLHLMRVALHVGTGGRLVARPSGGQGSHMLAAAARGNGFALVPDGPGLDAGDEVEVLAWDTDELGGTSLLLGSSEVPA
jgi:molybdenum cofactor synthesis domain-containing protein